MILRSGTYINHRNVLVFYIIFHWPRCTARSGFTRNGGIFSVLRHCLCSCFSKFQKVSYNGDSYKVRVVASGGSGGPPQFLVKQLTLSQPGGQIIPTTVLWAPPEFQTLRRAWGPTDPLWFRHPSFYGLFERPFTSAHLFQSRDCLEPNNKKPKYILKIPKCIKLT